ncbi:hypothetical protein D3C72_2576860 [compost metagenome]
MRLYQHIDTKHRLERFRSQSLFRAVQCMHVPLFKQQYPVAVTRGQVKVMQYDQHRRTAIGEIAHGL